LPNRVLVISPNPEFRRSLAFALEAEGYVVTSHAVLLAPDEGRGYDCVVLDHKAANLVPRETALDFCAHSPHIVLLGGRTEKWLSSRVFRAVEIPQKGDALTTAVRAAIDDASVSHQVGPSAPPALTG
jgi:hypothetical protein